MLYFTQNQPTSGVEIVKISHIQKIMKDLPADAKAQDAAWRSAYIRRMGVEPSDIYQELEMESRFADTHIDVSDHATPVALHSHDFYELIYCLSDCDVEYLVGAERYRLRKGDIVLVPPGISHRPLLPEKMPVPYRRQVLWISRDMMYNLRQSFPELYEREDLGGVMLRTAGTPWEYLADLFHNGNVEAEKREPGWELAVASNTITLLVHLRRAFLDRASGAVKAEKPELLDRLMAYIEENLGQKITLSQAAHHFYISESTITQLFRKKMGVSFYRCVTQRRLISAKRLIADGVALEAVSSCVGFQDYSSFYRAFKQEYGISPREYRLLQEAGVSKNPMF